MDTLRFGVVGLGIGRHRCMTISQTAGARLVAVCDLDEERCRRVAGETGCEWTTQYDELLSRKDIDVVMVMVPSGMHADFGVKAAQAGKHVITTKPIDVTLEAADRLIKACSDAGVMLAVDFDYRYQAPVALVKEAIDRGLFGDLVFGEVSLKWHRTQAYYDVGWRGTWKYDGGGSLMNQTVHDVDVLLWWMGKPKRVVGHASVNTHKIETEDLGMAIVEFESGAKGRILGTTTYPITRPVEKEIHGANLAAKITGLDTLEWIHGDGVSAPDLEYTGPRNVIEDVVAALRNGASPLVTGEEGRRSLELILAIYQSAREGRFVELSAP